MSNVQMPTGLKFNNNNAEKIIQFNSVGCLFLLIPKQKYLIHRFCLFLSPQRVSFEESALNEWIFHAQKCQFIYWTGFD